MIPRRYLKRRPHLLPVWTGRRTGIHGSAFDAGRKSILDGSLRRALRLQDKIIACDTGPKTQSAVSQAGHVEVCKDFGASSVFDSEKRFTLSGDIERLGECAAQVRGSLSGENWRALTVLLRDFRRDEAARSDARETLDSLLLSLAALAGFALDDMTQDDGWRLMMVGRRLERLQFLADLISRRLSSAQTPLRQELEWVLEIGDSAITYRTRYRAPPVWHTTVDLLVYDEKNPRALAFQWRAINTLLIEVAESLGSKPQETLYEAVSNLLELKYANLGHELDMVRVSGSLSLCLKDLLAAARAAFRPADVAAFLAHRF